jgi:RNA polymerase sigma-70 factor (ECF subfamily)
MTPVQQGPDNQDEDALLVKRAQRGDMEAFERLAQKYERSVFNIAFRMLVHYEDARDCAQEAFIKAYRALPMFQGAARFSTWLFRITTNCCLDMLRKRKNYREISLDDPIETGEGRHDARDVPSVESVETAVETAEFQRLVLRAVESLPEAHRAMIVMRDFQEMEYAEIAEALNCPEGTVKSRISRARGRLREALLALRELKGYLNVKKSESAVNGRDAESSG